ncbi:protein of unknown function DUF547 [Phytophthora cactorum]|nr:protein of unknown function DUF547 [Phytophthora cactorum]
MIAQGFPRGKGQWSHFLTRTCYALSRGPNGEQVSLSLAEIEHVILRARLPRAELSYLNVNSVITAANGPASRLNDLGIAHPDFRLSLALVMNHMNSEEIAIYEPENVHDQLNAVLRSLLNRSSAQGCLAMKEGSNTIMFPRVFEWYGCDFAAGIHGQHAAVASDQRAGPRRRPLRTKFRSFKYTPKTTLVEDKSCRPAIPETITGNMDSAQTKKVAG